LKRCGYQAPTDWRPRKFCKFNVESAAELEILMRNHRAACIESLPALSIRVNPDVKAGGHPHIATGLQQHKKFGVAWPEARRLYLGASKHKGD